MQRWKHASRITILCAFVLIFVAAVQVALSSGTRNIQVGRAWPRYLAVDTSRGIVYTDTLSGIYPPAGFTFVAVNGTSGEIIRELPLDGVPGPIAVDEERGEVYVTASSTLLIYDPSTMNFTKKVDMGKSASGAVFDRLTKMLYVTNMNGVFMINRDGQVVASQAAGKAPQGIAVDTRTGRIYVANYLSGTISVFSDTNLMAMGFIGMPAQSFPYQLALDSNKGLLYATTDGRQIAVLNVTSRSLAGEIQVGQSDANGTYLVALDQKNGYLYVATEPGNLIYQLDGNARRILRAFPLESPAYSLVVDESTGEVYVSNYHQITVIQPGPAPQDFGLEMSATVISVAVVVLVASLYKRNSLPAVKGRVALFHGNE